MRDFQKLDPQSLKAFYYACEYLNFTRAAERAALTQSGVSQHIAKLEENLGSPLFSRVGKRVFLTEAGKQLRIFTEEYLDRVDGLIESFRSEQQTLSGRVRYAMPATCLYTPHFSNLLEARKDFPQIDLRVDICHSEEVLRRLLENEIDFGFVTRNLPHANLIFQKFAQEEYVLASSHAADLKIDRVSDLLSRDCVAFPGMDVFLSHWQSQIFPKQKPIGIEQLRVRGEVNSLSAAITMISHGVGMTVLPRHCIVEQLQEKTLYAKRQKNCQNTIYIVSLRTSPKPKRVQRVLETFWKMRPESSYEFSHSLHQ